MPTVPAIAVDQGGHRILPRMLQAAARSCINCTQENLRELLCRRKQEFDEPARLYLASGNQVAWLRYSEWLMTCPVSVAPFDSKFVLGAVIFPTAGLFDRSYRPFQCTPKHHPNMATGHPYSPFKPNGAERRLQQTHHFINCVRCRYNRVWCVISLVDRPPKGKVYVFTQRMKGSPAPLPCLPAAVKHTCIRLGLVVHSPAEHVPGSPS